VILLVEDDDDSREALRDLVEVAGETSVAFSDGQSALDWLEATPSPSIGC